MLICTLRQFGLAIEDTATSLFSGENEMLRIGFPPVRLEILSKISGVEFEDIKRNKKASGRHKDLNDLENLR